jgi:hypothetical protein
LNVVNGYIQAIADGGKVSATNEIGNDTYNIDYVCDMDGTVTVNAVDLENALSSFAPSSKISCELVNGSEVRISSTTNRYRISTAEYAIHDGIPKVYTYIRDNKNVDNILTLRSQNDYPTAPIPVARAEDVLWAGYHNKNIFNGYSGYEPPQYGREYGDFVDFHPDDVAKIHKLGINYVLVDKQLSSDSSLLENVGNSSKEKLYEDSRYTLFKI